MPAPKQPPRAPRAAEADVEEQERAARLDLSLLGTVTPIGLVIGATGPRPPPPPMHPVAYGERHPAVPARVSLSARGLLAVTPHAPLLDPRDIDGRKAYLLQRWFEGAIESSTGKRCWSFRSERAAHVTKSKWYTLLLRAAALFVEYKIAPAAWCAWSRDIWLTYGKGKTPPIKWVFDPKRIMDRHGWFAAEANNYEGGITLYTDLARSFLARQLRMETALRSVPVNASDDDIAACVAVHFPQATHARLLADIAAEAHKQRQQLAERVYVGDWVWPW